MTSATYLSDYVELAESRDVFSNLLANAKLIKLQQLKKEQELTAQLQTLYAQGFSLLGESLDQLIEAAFPGMTFDDVVQQPGGKEKLVKFFKTKQFEALVEATVGQAFAAGEKLTAQAIVDHAYLAKGYGDMDLGVLYKGDFQVAAKIGQSEFTRIDPVATSQQALSTAIKDAKKLSDFVRKEIVAQLVDGTQRGEGMLKLEKRVVGLEGITKNRADIIVRYGVIRSFNDTRLAQYSEAKKVLGPTLKKVWVATMDGRVCPYCLALHGSVIELEEGFDQDASFVKKKAGFFGDKKIPPRHPRCRCTVIPYMESWLVGMVKTPEQMVAEAAKHAADLGYNGGNVEQKTEAKLMQVVASAKKAASNLTAANLDLTKVQVVATKLDALGSLPWMSGGAKAQAASLLKQFKAWETVAGAKAVLQAAAKSGDLVAAQKAMAAAHHVASAKKGYNFKQKAAAKALAGDLLKLVGSLSTLKAV